MCLEINQTPESLTDLTLELVRQDAYQQNIYIRPLAYKADEVIGVRLHNLKDDLTIFALHFEQYIKKDTAAEITAGTKVDHRPGGRGVMGPVAGNLRHLYSEILHGDNPQYSHWNAAV